MKLVNFFSGIPCADQENFARGGSNPDNVSFFMRGEGIQTALKVGHHQYASKTPFKWLFAVGWGVGWGGGQ